MCMVIFFSHVTFVLLHSPTPCKTIFYYENSTRSVRHVCASMFVCVRVFRVVQSRRTHAIICLIGENTGMKYTIFMFKNAILLFIVDNSWRWPRWCRLSCLRRSTVSSETLRKKVWSWVMRAISSWSARLRACVVWGPVLYTHSFRYPHRKKSGNVMPDKHAGCRVSPKCEITLWKRLQNTSMLQCDYLCKIHPRLLLRMPRMRECCRSKQCGLCWNNSLPLQTFQYAHFLKNHEDCCLHC
jgi:hypothetical protein